MPYLVVVVVAYFGFCSEKKKGRGTNTENHRDVKPCDYGHKNWAVSQFKACMLGSTQFEVAAVTGLRRVHTAHGSAAKRPASAIRGLAAAL